MWLIVLFWFIVILFPLVTLAVIIVGIVCSVKHYKYRKEISLERRVEKIQASEQRRLQYYYEKANNIERELHRELDELQ